MYTLIKFYDVNLNICVSRKLGKNNINRHFTEINSLISEKYLSIFNNTGKELLKENRAAKGPM